MDALILLVAFLVFMFIGMPVAYALGLATLVTALWIDMPLEAIMLKISDGMDDFALLAIPFFVLAGAIMAEGGMARRLVNLAKVFVGFIRGGLALVNVLASTLFGCLSGSSVADTASIGSVMIPEMVKNGYSKVFATNVTICGSVQAILVPPSHNSIIYSLAAGGTVSIARAVHGRRVSRPAVRRLPDRPGAVDGAPEGIPGRARGAAARSAEDRARRVLGPDHHRHHPRRHPVGRLHRRPNPARWPACTRSSAPCSSTATTSWRDLPKLVHRVTKTVAMVMMLIGFAAGFGYLMAIMQLPAKATSFFLSVTANKYVMLMLINVLLLLLGTFMDMAPMILICTPIMLPVVKAIGVDPVHFGMIMLLNLGIGLITPPVGPTLFVGCAIGKVTMEEVSKRAMAVLRRDVRRAAASSPTCRRFRSGCRTCWDIERESGKMTMQWQPSARFPDPAVVVVDESFSRYRLPLTTVERLATGCRWAEGPVWFGDSRSLVWSDIPNDRMLRWDEENGAVSIFRKPSGHANGNTRDRQGRLVTCEHGGRRVSRTELDGSIVTLVDSFEGKRLNSPNDVVCKSDGSIWFTDPTFGILGWYEGGEGRTRIADERLPPGSFGQGDGRRGRHQPAERPRLLAGREDSLHRAIALGAEEHTFF